MLHGQSLQCLSVNNTSNFMFSKKHTSVITFHGFGQSDAFGREVKSLLKHEDVESCTLMYHDNWYDGADRGKSTYSEIKSHLKEKNIDSDRFQVVIGYSLGTRLALSYVKHFSTEVRQLILIAPDCFHPQKIYQLATTNVGLLFFRLLTFIPFPFFILNFFPKYKGLTKTIKYLWGEKRNRLKLWLTWKYYANWFWDEKEALEFLSDHNIQVTVVTAINDEVGLDGKELERLNPPHLTKITLKSSHMNLWRVFLEKASVSGGKLVFKN